MEEKILAVQLMQDYIENHLTDDVNLKEIAEVSGYSPWYARRLFIEYVGISISEYIRKLRLKKSIFLLRDEKKKVIDTAYICGFESVDGFQRAFLKEFGCNPRIYEKNPIPVSLYTPYSTISKNIKRRDKKMETSNIFLQVIEKPARKVIIKRGIKANEYMSYCNEVGCDIWGILLSIKSISNEPVCLFLPKQYIKENTSEYVQGVEVELDYDGVIPEGFDVIELPACQYLMFNGEPFKEEDFEEAIENVWKAEKKYDPKTIGYCWDLDNPRIQLEPIGSRGYIELLPIKKI